VPGGLLTDLYELNMAASYLRRSMTGQATFSLFVRALPPAAGSWSPPGWRTACSSCRISPSPPMIWLPAPGPRLRGRHPARLRGLAVHRGRAGGLVQRAYGRERQDHRLFFCCPAGRRGRLRRAVAPYQREVKDRPGPGSTLSVNSIPTAPRWINSLWGLHLSGADEQRPRNAVVVAVGRTKILWLLRLLMGKCRPASFKGLPIWPTGVPGRFADRRAGRRLTASLRLGAGQRGRSVGIC